MATTVYLRAPGGNPPLWETAACFTVKDSDRAVTLGGSTFASMTGIGYALDTNIGSGAGGTTGFDTIAGPVGPQFSVVSAFFSAPLAADVTISGTVSFNIYAHETSMNANTQVGMAVYRVDAQGALTLIIHVQKGTELGTSKALQTFSGTPTSTAMKKGDRLMGILTIDDATSVTMGAGFGVIVAYDGDAANTAHSRVDFTETLTFLTTDPTGSVYYLRNTASDISGAKALSTTQGSGTVTAVHATIDGPHTFPGDQWTLTAGGADFEHFGPQLAAFTLGDVVLLHLGGTTALERANGAPFDSLVAELAVCDGDGSNPVVWARCYTSTTRDPVTTPSKYYLSGEDLAVTEGQRLRLRFYSDDFWPNTQASGTNRTIRYDGTSAYASRLIFTQTITEAVVAVASAPYIVLQAVTRAAYH